MLEWRDSLGADEVARRSKAAASHLVGFLENWPGFAAVETVSGFWAIGRELDPRPALDWCAGQGKTTALPIVAARENPLVFRKWQEGDPLDLGVMRIPIPTADAPEVEPDLLIVPLLAFDRSGMRLGYGGGYYDRTLARLKSKRSITAIGWAHSEQEMAEVPTGPYDVPLDGIVTEKAYIPCP